MSLPIGASDGSIKSPSASSLIPSSFEEHSMPSESRPRSFVCLILKPPGSSAPSTATGTLSPAFMFLAPQTMFNFFSFPASTVQYTSLSAFGCASIFSIRPTTTPLKSPSRVRLSTSIPRDMNFADRASGARSKSTNSFSQL